MVSQRNQENRITAGAEPSNKSRLACGKRALLWTQNHFVIGWRVSLLLTFLVLIDYFGAHENKNALIPLAGQPPALNPCEGEEPCRPHLKIT
jgi:hypothetical protein